jgi:hypothetical protein
MNDQHMEDAQVSVSMPPTNQAAAVLSHAPSNPLFIISQAQTSTNVASTPGLPTRELTLQEEMVAIHSGTSRVHHQTTSSLAGREPPPMLHRWVMTALAAAETGARTVSRGVGEKVAHAGGARPTAGAGCS